jgi:hypothetical protein
MTDPGAIQAHVESLIREFLARVPGAHNFETPTVSVAFTPGLSWMSSARPHVMHVAPWEQCPPAVQGFFASVSAGSAGANASDFYRAGFYNFLIPHEMSHFIDYERGRGPTPDQRYESELKANRIAVAFWIDRSGGFEWLSRFIPLIQAALTRLPVPVPPGEEPTAYFNSSYDALLANPVAYAWFQWQMGLEAWSQRQTATCESLVGDA